MIPNSATGQQLDSWCSIVIINEIFIIYTNPIPYTRMVHYLYVLSWYAVHYLQQGVHDTHIIFDNPGRITDDPKSIEHKQRDSEFAGHLSHCTFDDTVSSRKRAHGRWHLTLGLDWGMDQYRRGITVSVIRERAPRKIRISLCTDLLIRI